MLKYTMGLLFVLAATLPACADHHKSDHHKSADHHQSKMMKKLTGVWKIEEGKNQGEDLSADELAGKVIIDGNEIISYDKNEKELYRAIFSLDPKSDPVGITMVSTRKGRKATAFGILKFEEKDDEMWLCYGLPGSPRPEGFQSPGDSKNMLMELQRTKKNPISESELK
jgi:uncharacterized protein (TIGR03067 family)